MEGSERCVLLEWDDSVGPFFRRDDAIRVLEDQEGALTRVAVRCQEEYPQHQVIPMPNSNDKNAVISQRSVIDER